MVKMNCGAMPSKLREAAEPGESEAGSDEEEHDGAAREPRRDLTLLGHLAEMRSEVAVHRAQLLSRRRSEELAARLVGDGLQRVGVRRNRDVLHHAVAVGDGRDAVG